MATIRASCRKDGDVELLPEDLTVVQIDYLNSPQEAVFNYRFRCPTCSLVEIKPTENRTVDILAAAGVEMERIIMYPDVSWDLISFVNGRLTEDEVIDLTIAIHENDTPQAKLA